MMKKLQQIGLLLILIGTPVLSQAQYHIRGFVSVAENRFKNNVHEFVNEFRSNKRIGSRKIPWRTANAYWSEPRMFLADDRYYVDNADFAYVSGHGGAFYIETHQARREGVTFFHSRLNTPPQLGDRDLEFMVIQSCQTVRSARDHSRWRSRWGSTFHRLHMVIGYRTNSVSMWNHVSRDYARRLKRNHGIWSAWWHTIQAERNSLRSVFQNEFYPGKPSMIVEKGHEGERLGRILADPKGNNNGSSLYSIYEYKLNVSTKR
ncbi:MAG: DUF6345 domain-containing protein [Bacteroidota bacterium]